MRKGHIKELSTNCYSLACAIARVKAIKYLSCFDIELLGALALPKLSFLRVWGLTAQRGWARLILNRPGVWWCLLSRLMRLEAFQTQTHRTTTTLCFPATGRLPHPLLALAGAVVTNLSKHFGVHCLPAVLLLVPTPTWGGREKQNALAG